MASRIACRGGQIEPGADVKEFRSWAGTERLNTDRRKDPGRMRREVQ
jgi:hypothetical protein